MRPRCGLNVATGVLDSSVTKEDAQLHHPGVDRALVGITSASCRDSAFELKGVLATRSS